ncbi:MAG: ABC transporter permease [Methanosarcina mazei]|nr:ABC transporter permease [Methanosarcina mazei]
MTKRTSLSIFSSVVFALFLREVQTRFGTKRLGYFWAILDPLSKIIVFSLVKAALMDRSMPGVDYPVFLATGFLTFGFFQAFMNGSMNSFDANRALFVYKQVKPIDAIVSRFCLEFLVMSVAIMVFVGFGMYIGLDVLPKDLSMVLLAVLWLGVFAFGVGVLFAVLASFYETFAKVIGFLGTPLFFLSGLLYTVESLPPVAREIVLYNPVIHFIEMIHGNYFLVLDTQYVDYQYMMYWTIIPLFVGLYFYIKSEKKILAS